MVSDSRAAPAAEKESPLKQSKVRRREILPSNRNLKSDNVQRMQFDKSEHLLKERAPEVRGLHSQGVIHSVKE